MAGHAQLKFVMTECSKTQIRLTGLICFLQASLVSVQLDLFASYMFDSRLKIRCVLTAFLFSESGVHIFCL